MGCGCMCISGSQRRRKVRLHSCLLSTFSRRTSGIGNNKYLGRMLRNDADAAKPFICKDMPKLVSEATMRYIEKEEYFARIESQHERSNTSLASCVFNPNIWNYISVVCLKRLSCLYFFYIIQIVTFVTFPNFFFINKII